MKADDRACAGNDFADVRESRPLIQSPGSGGAQAERSSRGPLRPGLRERDAQGARGSTHDLVLVSHGHFDHVGDVVAIAEKTKAKLVTTFDLGKAMVQHLGYPEGPRRVLRCDADGRRPRSAASPPRRR
ncbi:MAG: MBL fold metallo-hydrolase [Deltaproteobacteria bacterium]|nr:MBL fold metallo-hydrolase [Deltaproteobacteria bacterium]